MAFWVIGFGLFGLGMASSLLYVAWQIKTGHGGDTYYNHRLQPITHWGYVGTLAIALVAVIVGLVYRGREMLERHKQANRTIHCRRSSRRTARRLNGGVGAHHVRRSMGYVWLVVARHSGWCSGLRRVGAIQQLGAELGVLAASAKLGAHPSARGDHYCCCDWCRVRG